MIAIERDVLEYIWNLIQSIDSIKVVQVKKNQLYLVKLKERRGKVH